LLEAVAAVLALIPEILKVAVLAALEGTDVLCLANRLAVALLLKAH